MAQELKIQYKSTKELIPYVNNSRTHNDEQVTQIAASIREWGFTNPLLIDEQSGIIAGHGRLMAAQKLGLAEVPVLQAAHLSNAQKRAYIIADNRLALDAGWDEELLRVEFAELTDLGFDLDLTGFEVVELQNIFLESEKIEPEKDSSAKEIDVDSYEMSCICPKCGFEFDDK